MTPLNIETGEYEKDDYDLLEILQSYFEGQRTDEVILDLWQRDVLPLKDKVMILAYWVECWLGDLGDDTRDYLKQPVNDDDIAYYNTCIKHAKTTLRILKEEVEKHKG